MAMMIDILLIILGVTMVLMGADRLTDGASALARRMSIPEFIVGLTVVAAGTSAPELFVSLVSALKGTPDMAVGNVVGSNTMNSMLIVGAAALTAPITISKRTVQKDLPFTVLASLLMLVLTVNGGLSRIDGILMLLVFALFMFVSIRSAEKRYETYDERPIPIWKNLFFVVGGLALLLVGSNIFVDSATNVAYSLGISEGVVGLTVVAGGTSLPELATSVVAARKGQSAIAIGNVIGSNVFNILLILGMTATITPLEIEGITTIDMAVMLLSVSLVWLFSCTRYKVERWEGATLVIGYLAYVVWLIASL